MDQLERQALSELFEAEDISKLSIMELEKLFRQEPGLALRLPDGLCQIDPRNGDAILYASRRGSRPHDNFPQETADPPANESCPICQGQTTGVVDVARLSEGFTFINKNLFPIVYPFTGERAPNDAACGTQGMHFLQWTSSLHDQDWQNMSLSDLLLVMSRLAALEKKLLQTGQQVLILKNYGRLVGGSLVHGHQQIILTTIRPKRFGDNERFLQERNEFFSSFLLRQNPAQFTIRDYGPAVLLVPYFMRRPLEMMLLLKDPSRQFLHQLNEEELRAVTQGWQEAIQVTRQLMPMMGREIAYNITCHNGSGAGLYFEFLPYTQEIGGLEHLGIYACQATPSAISKQIRQNIKN